MREIISILLLLIGVVLMLISALGVVRLPDLYLRMSASTKSSTIGVASVLLAAAIYFNDLGIATRAIATIIFLLLTAPVAAHMIGRAAYFNGVPLWKGTRFDELKGRYDPRTHYLSSGPEDVPAPAPAQPPAPDPTHPQV